MLHLFLLLIDYAPLLHVYHAFPPGDSQSQIRASHNPSRLKVSSSRFSIARRSSGGSGAGAITVVGGRRSTQRPLLLLVSQNLQARKSPPTASLKRASSTRSQ